MHPILKAYTDRIRSYTNKCQSIYLSIGSACGMLQILDNGTKFLDEMYHQQYPPCMKKLKLMMIDSDMHIILIDKSMEKIPYVVANCDMTSVGKEWTVENSDGLEIYHDDELKIHVYVFREYVKYLEDEDDNEYFKDFVDVFPFMLELNNIAIHNKTFLLANDFCGRPIRKVTSRFRDQINGFNDSIIYGFDHDGGCYVNLSLPESDFVFNISDKIRVFLFDKFFSYNEIMNAIAKMNSDEKNIILRKLDEYIYNIDRDIKNLLLPEMRKCKLLMDGKDATIYPKIIDSFLHQFNSDFDTKDMYSEKNYGVIFDFCQYVFKKSCEKVFSFFGKSKDNIEELMVLILSEPNVYNWTKIYDNYLKSIKTL